MAVADDKGLRARKEKFEEKVVSNIDNDAPSLPWESMTVDERDAHESEIEDELESLDGVRRAVCCSGHYVGPAGIDSIEPDYDLNTYEAKVEVQGATVLLWLSF